MVRTAPQISLCNCKLLVTVRRQWHPTPGLLPGKSHGQRSLVGCNPWGCEESDMTERLHFHFLLSCIGEGNGNPLQCSCLENPRDGEPGGLLSMGSHRVGHDWSDLAAAAAWQSPDSNQGVWLLPSTPDSYSVLIWVLNTLLSFFFIAWCSFRDQSGNYPGSGSNTEETFPLVCWRTS